MTQTPPKPTAKNLSDSNIKNGSKSDYSDFASQPVRIRETSPKTAKTKTQMSWWQRLSLSTKAAIIAVGIGVVPIVTVSLIGYSVVNR
ncbi:MAG: hypothetical protein AAGF26_15495, partial [Cyanobacteria bacterium P01_G01_bin.49]